MAIYDFLGFVVSQLPMMQPTMVSLQQAMMASSGHTVRKFVYVNREQGSANSCRIVAEIQFSQASLEKVTSFTYSQRFASIFFVLVWRVLLQFNQQHQLIQQMIENIAQLAKDRDQYLLQCHKSQIVKQIKQTEAKFHSQAIQLIQNEMKVSQILIMSQAIKTITRKIKREGFDCIFGVHSVEKHHKKQQKLSVNGRGRLFVWKINRILKQRQQFFLLTAFKIVSAQNYIAIDHRKIEQTTIQAPFDMMNMSNISGIEPKIKRYDIDEKMEKQKKEIQVLRQKLYLKRKEIAKYEYKIQQSKTKKGREDKMDKTDSAQEVIGKLIKNNFDLQEKLQAVYELIQQIDPQSTTPHIHKLLSLTKKPNFNIELAPMI